MNIRNIYIRIGFVLVVSFIFFYLLYVLRSIFNPLLIALVISYILHPAVKLLEKVFKSRTAAILFIYLLFLFSTLLVIIFIVPPALSDGYKFLSAFFVGDERNPPVFVSLIEKISKSLEKRLEHLPSVSNAIKSKLDINNIKGYFLETFKMLFTGESEWIKSFFNIILIYLILVPIYVIFISFYIEKIYKFFIFYLPPKYQDTILDFFRKVNRIVSAYIRGKFWVAVIKTILTFVCLITFGSAFPLAFCGLQFISTFVPNLFIVVGILPNFIINAMQWDLTSAVVLGSLGSLVVIEVIEGFVLTPVILGKNVGLHPFVVFIALLAGAKLFGILGLIIAIPIVSIVKVVWVDYIGPALKEALSHPPFSE